MDPIGNPRTETQDQVDRGPRTQGLTSINRRDWLRLTVGGGAGLALGELLDVSTVRAATQRLKLENVNEFTTSCNFCSCDHCLPCREPRKHELQRFACLKA